VRRPPAWIRSRCSREAPRLQRPALGPAAQAPRRAGSRVPGPACRQGKPTGDGKSPPQAAPLRPGGEDGSSIPVLDGDSSFSRAGRRCPRVWSRRHKPSRRALVKRPYTDYPDWRFNSARHPLIIRGAGIRRNVSATRSGNAGENEKACLTEGVTPSPTPSSPVDLQSPGLTGGSIRRSKPFHLDDFARS
jgi:hypothetical protein